MENYILNKDNFEEALLRCSDTLKRKCSFLLIPTETVYGLVCTWDDNKAIKKIYKAKRRDENKPFQMLVSDTDMVKSYGGIISDITEKIVKAFCPGPITIIIPTVKGSTIGFRIPEHEFTLKLIKKCNFPLAGTSANLSGDPSALAAEDALRNLLVKPDITIDSGKISSNSKSSTVIKINGLKIELLREGPVSIDDINSILLN